MAKGSVGKKNRKNEVQNDPTPCEDCVHWPLGVCSMAGEKSTPCKGFVPAVPQGGENGEVRP